MINLDAFSEPECLHSIKAFLKYSGRFFYCIILSESQISLTISVPKTPSLVQRWNVRPQNTQPGSTDISWHPPQTFVSSHVAFFLKVSDSVTLFWLTLFFQFVFILMNACCCLHWSVCLEECFLHCFPMEA